MNSKGDALIKGKKQKNEKKQGRRKKKGLGHKNFENTLTSMTRKASHGRKEIPHGLVLFCLLL